MTIYGKIIQIFLYTSTNLGFTIKHTSNWALNYTNTVNDNKVIFTSPDGVGVVFVQAQNATRYEIAVYNVSNSAKTNTIRTHLTPGEKIIELDVNHYMLFQVIMQLELLKLKVLVNQDNLYHLSPMMLKV